MLQDLHDGGVSSENRTGGFGAQRAHRNSMRALMFVEPVIGGSVLGISGVREFIDGFLDFWISCHLDFWISGFLGFWISGFLDF